MTNAHSTLQTVKDKITAHLQAAFHPTELRVTDDSHRHADHYVHPGGAGHQGETHFSVKIVSPAFTNMSRIARHRAVNEALAAELAGGVHALALDVKAPGE